MRDLKLCKFDFVGSNPSMLGIWGCAALPVGLLAPDASHYFVSGHIGGSVSKSPSPPSLFSLRAACDQLRGKCTWVR